jgi:tetratricopeptide (TPR) repeat protein
MGSRPARAAWLGLLLGACSATADVEAGRAALEDHALSEAERHFRSALEREPGHVGALGGLGWTYQVAGQREAARASFSRCLDAAPTAPECLRGLAAVALAEGELGQARALLATAKAEAPDDLRVEGSLALLALASGEVERAAERYARLVALAPEVPEYRLGAAECALRQGRPLDAISAADVLIADPKLPRRQRAVVLQLKARALLSATEGREDPADCAGTAPPLRAWLDAAEQAVTEAEAVGVGLTELPAVRRQIHRRRAVIEQVCPAVQPSAAELLGGPAPAP